jgi:beta-lysine 5,6-aminomutase beta subunit
MKKIIPYGDKINDGRVQLSFTLPVDQSLEAIEAAKLVAENMNLKDVSVTYSESMGNGFSMFVVYGTYNSNFIDFDKIKVDKPEFEILDFYEINDLIKEKIQRKIKVIGACTGEDAHTVGIDAIMNMKGFDGHYGLERFPEIEALNLGAQVSNEDLIKEAIEFNADAILISQVVNQNNIHLKNLTNFIELIEAEHIRENFILCIGGPHITHKLALELGFDAGFGRNTYSEDVATFIANKMVYKLWEN